MAKLGKRNLKIISVIFDKRHYIAAWNMLRFCRRPLDFFARYFFGTGAYPCRIGLRTPTGEAAPEIFSYFDSLTINEIFFRLDYEASRDIRTVVDLGANIGISALYFLSRNRESRAYLYEPVAENIVKLKENLKDFSARIEINEKAVFTATGKRKFGADEYGRLGGLHRESDRYLEVDYVSINDVLAAVLAENQEIDILKIDIEGDEIAVVRSIKEEYLPRIKKIYFEIDHTVNIDNSFRAFPKYFCESRRGNTYIMKNKNSLNVK